MSLHVLSQHEVYYTKTSTENLYKTGLSYELVAWTNRKTFDRMIPRPGSINPYSPNALDKEFKSACMYTSLVTVGRLLPLAPYITCFDDFKDLEEIQSYS